MMKGAVKFAIIPLCALSLIALVWFDSAISFASKFGPPDNPSAISFASNFGPPDNPSAISFASKFDPPDNPVSKSHYLKAPKTREEIGDILETFKFKTGAELGVQRGLYSETILKRWKSCQTYYLVDVWRPLTYYKDGSNVDQKQQNSLFEETKTRLKPWQNITAFYRMSTDEAVKKFSDESLDFVYIDARHDYCAVKEDIENYWPKITPGGVLSGHDYSSSLRKNGIDDFEICKNGSKAVGSVKRAVDEFVIKEQLVLSMTYGYGVSWIVRKPFD